MSVCVCVPDRAVSVCWLAECSNQTCPSVCVCQTVLCLHAGWLLHVLSLLSSSFVEEEHQTCYFLAVTTWLAMAAQLLIHKLQHSNSCRTTDQSPSKKLLSTGFSLVLLCSAISYTHTHTRLTALFPGLPR